MAHIFVKNSLSELKAAKVNINVTSVVTTESEGDPLFVLEAATTYPSISGTKIRPAYANKINDNNLDYTIDELVSKIASSIDWAPLEKDTVPPIIQSVAPIGNAVSIASNIYIDLIDERPSSGIDLSEAQIMLNNGVIDFNITEECTIEGTPFNYIIRWIPPLRIMT